MTWTNQISPSWKMISHQYTLLIYTAKCLSKSRREDSSLSLLPSPIYASSSSSFPLCKTMARHTPERYFGSESGSGSAIETTKRIASGFYQSVSAAMASCSKQAVRVSGKFRSKISNSKIAPKLPLARPKRMLTNISNKAIPFLQKKKGSEELDGRGGAEEKFGDGGVWQRAILMGDKCQPLDFSGVIYYDNKGEQLHELPLRSPRASPLPGYAYRN